MSYSWFVLLTTMITYANCNNTMIVVWGKPTSFYNPTPYLNTTLNWEQCILECYKFERCVLAYQNTTGCNLFVFDGLPTISKLNSSSGLQVAFKVQASGDTCPVGTNAPTFNNKNASGYLYLTDIKFPTKVFYNISLSGSSWKLTYTALPLCPPSYSTYGVYKDDTQICLIILWSNITAGGYQNVSADTCKSFGGVLPTINNPDDIYFFSFLVKAYLKFFNADKFYVRIDGIRTKTCQSTPTSAACMTPAGFTFTDPHFKKNFTYYDWVTNAGAKVQSDDHCLVLSYPNTTGSLLQTDVRSCTTKGTVQALGMICVRDAFVA